MLRSRLTSDVTAGAESPGNSFQSRGGLVAARQFADISAMQTRSDRIAVRLRSGFAPSALEVIDESDRHVGHAGARLEGETHYSVRLVSAHFRGLSRVERARAVHAALEPEFGDGLHALSLTLRTPEEEARK